MSHEKEAVMINLSPEACNRITLGEQIAFLKKTRPNLNPPFKVYVCCGMAGLPTYVTNDKLETVSVYEECPDIINGRVIAEFVCKDIAKITDAVTHYEVQGFVERGLHQILYEDACSNYEQLYRLLSKKSAYAWYVSNLKVYDTPKKVSDFCKPDYKHKGFGTWVWKQGRYLTQPPTNWCYVKDWFYTEKGGV